MMNCIFQHTCFGDRKEKESGIYSASEVEVGARKTQARSSKLTGKLVTVQGIEIK